MWGLKQITSSWWFLDNEPHVQHLGHPQPYTSTTISSSSSSSTVHDGRTANTREWMMMMMKKKKKKKQLKAWSNGKSSCIFLKNKPSILNWYVLGIWPPVFYTCSIFYARGEDGCDWGSNLVLIGTTVQCYTPTPQYLLCSQHFSVQFLSILTWSWSWRWTPRRECFDPNCVRSDGCMLYKCGYRLPASPPVKIFKVYVLE